jgi:hypothetical protein
MMRFMLRTSLASAALFAGALLAHAQAVPPAGPPAQAAPIPDDQAGSIAVPPPPAPPAIPAPDDDSDED